MNRVLARPPLAAWVFSVVATGSSCIAAALEGRLLTAEVGVKPLIANLSTLVDFLILDPLGIYFSLRCVTAAAALDIPTTTLRRLTGAFVIAVICMAFYVRSFLEGRFLDAAVSAPGIGGITVTGWVVFSWTTVFLAVICLGLMAQVAYCLAIFRLTPHEMRYYPLHQDRSGGMMRFAEPAWHFLNAMLILFAISIGFVVQDWLINRVDSSLRLQGSVAYALVAIPLFLAPVLRLRHFMIQHRDGILRQLYLSHPVIGVPLFDRAPADLRGILPEVESFLRLRNQVEQFPTWPLPLAVRVKVLPYLIGPVVPLALKLLEYISGVLRGMKP